MARLREQALVLLRVSVLLDLLKIDGGDVDSRRWEGWVLSPSLQYDGGTNLGCSEVQAGFGSQRGLPHIPRLHRIAMLPDVQQIVHRDVTRYIHSYSKASCP